MVIGSDTILLTFLIFCRIGGCLALMPGISSPRVPVQIRLFLAIAVTLALTPLLLPALEAAISDRRNVLGLLLSETGTGLLIGLLGRVFFVALQFVGVALAMCIGFGNTPDAPIEEAEPLPAVASLIMLTAIVLFFLTDQYWDVLRALIASYSALPVSEPFSAAFAVTKLADALAQAFLLALQIGSPFIIYAVIINLTFGLINKLTPQIPVYFISTPFVLAGGFFLLYFTVGEFLQIFIAAFASWLQKG